MPARFGGACLGSLSSVAAKSIAIGCIACAVKPETDIRVRLPDAWSQRYLHFGGGGFDGSIPNLNSPVMNVGRNPIAYGYAVAGSNGGHRSADYPGASFAPDRALTLSYATAAIYDTDVVARAAIQTYYGNPAKYRYFAGCSNGGKNASVAAAVFIDDYDGIVGGDGVWGHSDDNMGGSEMSGMTAKWAVNVQATRAVPISSAKGAAVRAAQFAACDANDGLADGILSNPEACHFDPQVMLCPGASNNSCLTQAEIDTVKLLRSDLKDASGRVIGAQANASTTALSGGFVGMAFGVANYDLNTFDVNRDFPTLKTALDNIYSMSGELPGLTDYLHKGKKLIIYHGWDDMLVQPYVSTRTYAALQQSAGADASNARLYMFPGMGHCAGGVGPDQADLISAITAWVESGTAPGTLVSAKLSGVASPYKRPLCPYPQVPMYTGGPNTLFTSFTCRNVSQ